MLDLFDEFPAVIQALDIAEIGYAVCGVLQGSAVSEGDYRKHLQEKYP